MIVFATLEQHLDAHREAGRHVEVMLGEVDEVRMVRTMRVELVAMYLEGEVTCELVSVGHHRGFAMKWLRELERRQNIQL